MLNKIKTGGVVYFNPNRSWGTVLERKKRKFKQIELMQTYQWWGNAIPIYDNAHSIQGTVTRSLFQ